jgi:hypothetical protein
MYRTCSEAHAADPSLTMGNYWIDPDGQGVGDDPIFVYCDMTTGTKKGIMRNNKNKSYTTTNDLQGKQPSYTTAKIR